VNPAEIPSLDLGLGSFYNVNSPDQWREALALAELARKGHSPHAAQQEGALAPVAQQARPS
jgi:hypothetical protein